MSASIVCIDGFFQFLMKAVFNYTGAPELEYSVSFAKAHIEHIVECMISSQYLDKQLRSSFLRDMILGRRMTEKAEVVALLKAQNEIRVNGK